MPLRKTASLSKLIESFQLPSPSSHLLSPSQHVYSSASSPSLFSYTNSPTSPSSLLLTPSPTSEKGPIIIVPSFESRSAGETDSMKDEEFVCPGAPKRSLIELPDF
ncbi:hypothetical protein IAR50_006707 [Cryptococcus sp. DSM 104548]